MPESAKPSIPEILADRPRIAAALSRGVRDALLTHARLGRSVPEQLNGTVVWLTPADIFARYGLDENGRPLSGDGR